MALKARHPSARSKPRHPRDAKRPVPAIIRILLGQALRGQQVLLLDKGVFVVVAQEPAKGRTLLVNAGGGRWASSNLRVVINAD